MAWIETHDDIWDHHKLYRLCTAVNQPNYAVVGRLISLWHFVLRNAWRDSNLEPWGDVGIERASLWDGEKGLWVKALRECGFLDGFIVHGWQERAGRLVQDRRRNERRKIRRSNGGKAAAERRKAVRRSVATLPNPTLPNPTLPDQGGGESAPAPHATPEDLVALWNSKAHPNLPRVELLTDLRKTHAKARLQKFPAFEFWDGLMDKINASPFLRGEGPSRDGGKPWACNFDWILSPQNLAKIIEGNYDAKRR